MNVIATTWRGLVQRRLWPLAVLLVAALAAVPFTLAKSPAPAPADPAPAAQKPSSEDDTSSFVTLASAPEEGKTTKRRRVLGAAKDPFEPAPKPKSKKKKKAKASATATPTATTTPPTGGAGSPPPSSTPPVSPTPTPGPMVPKYSIKVRFGPTDAELALQTLERLEPLESGDEPVLVYEGVDDHGAAIFSIAGNVTAQGDGTCMPSLSDCQTLKLKADDTEFITVSDTGDAATDAQFQLDVVKIYKKATSVADAAADGTDAEASSLRKRTVKGYRFDASTGTLHRVKSRSKRASF